LCGGLLLSEPFKIDQNHRLPILSGQTFNHGAKTAGQGPQVPSA
jgi:hypothetical protein